MPAHLSMGVAIIEDEYLPECDFGGCYMTHGVVDMDGFVHLKS